MEIDTVELVNAAIAGDRDAVISAFQNSIAPKVNDALELKKVEIASNLLGTEDTQDEIQTVETEVDGSSYDESEISSNSET